MNNSLQLLINTFKKNHTDKATQSLWFIDESASDLLPELAPYKDSVTIQTNRYDIWAQANVLNLPCEFSDLHFDCANTQQHDCAFLRISKEKAVVHRAINAMYSNLREQGILYIAGEKNEGIKSYADKLCLLSNSRNKPKKNGNAYIANYKRATITQQTCWLDDDNYTEVRPIGEIDKLTIYSKPGVFGWNKFDHGSELLITTTNNYIKTIKNKQNKENNNTLSFDSCLDLGCGYGYLSLAMQKNAFKHYWATDSNAAAITCLSYNSRVLNKRIEVVAGNCGNTITRQFDLILCNPPFHQGFSVEGELTHLFLKATKRLLKPNGFAFFVVNSFIPIEKKAREEFNTVTLLEQSPQFKVIMLSHKKNLASHLI